MKYFRILAPVLALAMILSACTRTPAASDTTEARETERPVATAAEAVTTQTTTQPPAPVTEPRPTEPLAEGPGEIELETLAEPAPAKDYAALLQLLGNYNYNAIPSRDPGEDGEDLPAGGNSGEQLDAELPVPGVTAPDRIVKDGDNLYMLDSYGLTVVSLAGKDSRILCAVPVEKEPNAWLEELFVSGDRAGILYTCASFGEDENGNWYDSNSTHLVIYDLSDPSAPVKLADSGVEGSYLGARLVGQSVCLLTNRYFWAVDPQGDPTSVAPAVLENGTASKLPPEKIYLCPNPNSTALTVLASISLADGKVLDSLSFTDASTAYAVREDAVYLGRPLWQYGACPAYADGSYAVTDREAKARTELKRVALGEDGSLRLDGCCLLDGGLTGPSALRGEGDSLWAVTSVRNLHWSEFTDATQGWSNVRWGDTERWNLFTVLTEDLNTCGRLEHVAEDREIAACRALDGLVCLTTYDRTDPVYPLELSDLTAPRALEPLTEITRYDAMLPVFRQSFLCLSAEQQGLRLRCYAWEEGEALRCLGEQSMPDYAGTSALTDAEAWFLDPDTGLIGFLVDGSADEGYRYAVLTMQDGAFTQPQTFDLPYLPTDVRAISVGELLYICSPNTTYVTDPAGMKLLATITNAEG